MIRQFILVGGTNENPEAIVNLDQIVSVSRGVVVGTSVIYTTNGPSYEIQVPLERVMDLLKKECR